MRVVLVSHYFEDHRGGIEIVTAELARRLAARGVDVRWAASAPAPAAIDGVARLPMPAWNGGERFGVPYPIWSPARLPSLAREIAAADVVHLQDSVYAGNVTAFLLARRHRRPVVVTQHIGDVPYDRALLRGALALANRTVARAVLGGADAAVFISARVRGYFSSLGTRFRQPPRFWPNGVDRARFFPLADDERRALRRRLGLSDRPLILFVGRFVEKKGVTRLRPLAERFTDCDWLFAGAGPDDPARWRLPNVRTPGLVDHAALAPLYQAADLLVLPSVGEGFPLVVQEAMACGTPALVGAETAAGMPGVERVAFVAALEPVPLAAALSAALADRAALAARRRDVAAFARAWDWDACAARYAALYDELAGRR